MSGRCCARPPCSPRATTSTAGEIDAAALAAVEDDAIRDAVRLQEDAGLQSATDGEFRREQWHSDFLYSIRGIDKGALGMPLPVYTKDGTDHLDAERHRDHRAAAHGNDDLR